MTRVEFLKATAYLAAGIGKALPEQSLEVYFDCLGDLPFDVLMLAAKRVLLEHRYANFPTIAELREAAADTRQGKVASLTAAEAWEMAWDAVKRMDPEVEGKVSRVIASLPPLVVEAMQTFGIPSLCYGQEPVGVVRGQFTKIYEQLAARDKRLALMPAPLRTAIEGVAKSVPASIATHINNLGKMPELPARSES